MTRGAGSLPKLLHRHRMIACIQNGKACSELYSEWTYSSILNLAYDTPVSESLTEGTMAIGLFDVDTVGSEKSALFAAYSLKTGVWMNRRNGPSRRR